MHNWDETNQILDECLALLNNMSSYSSSASLEAIKLRPHHRKDLSPKELLPDDVILIRDKGSSYGEPYHLKVIDTFIGTDTVIGDRYIVATRTRYSDIKYVDLKPGDYKFLGYYRTFWKCLKSFDFRLYDPYPENESIIPNQFIASVG